MDGMQDCFVKLKRAPDADNGYPVVRRPPWVEAYRGGRPRRRRGASLLRGPEVLPVKGDRGQDRGTLEGDEERLGGYLDRG